MKGKKVICIPCGDLDGRFCIPMKSTIQVSNKEAFKVKDFGWFRWSDMKEVLKGKQNVWYEATII